MSQFFVIHPDNPQKRLILQAVQCVEQGGVIIYPTDSGYALGCAIGNKSAMERIRQIRRLDNKHNFTLLCRDLSDISLYAKVNNSAYRILKSMTPGPYTFILEASKEVPKRLRHPKRKTIGLRVPENNIAHDLLVQLNEPLMSSTLIMPGDEMPLTDPYEMRDLLSHQVELIIDGGYCGFEPTTVIDLMEDIPKIIRQGRGDASAFITE